MKPVAILFLFALSASGQTLRPDRFEDLRKACIPEADRGLIVGIVRTESAFRPNALSLNYPETLARRAGLPSGRLFLKNQPRTPVEALRWAHILMGQGMTLSVGLMQVNAEQGFAIERLLDPCENLRTGWRIFSDKFVRAQRRAATPAQALRMALSDYNSGSVTAGQANGYVGRVLLVAIGGR